MWKEPTVLIGPGGHAKSVGAALAVPARRLVAEGEDEAFVSSYMGEPIIVTVGYVGIGAPEMSVRRKVLDYYVRAGVTFGTAVASSAVVVSSAEIGEGSAVLARAVVNADAKIGRHCILNTGVIVEHDVELGENVGLAPGAIILGAAKIGANTFVGAGAIVAQGVTICSNTVIGAGAFVRHDIFESGVYVGNPLRRVR